MTTRHRQEVHINILIITLLNEDKSLSLEYVRNEKEYEKITQMRLDKMSELKKIISM